MFWWTLGSFAGGFVASIYTWPWLRLKLTGAAAEASSLRAKAQEIEKKILGK